MEGERVVPGLVIACHTARQTSTMTGFTVHGMVL